MINTNLSRICWKGEILSLCIIKIYKFRLRNQTDFVIPQVKSVSYGLKSIKVLEPKIWESLPNDLKNKESVDSFK